MDIVYQNNITINGDINYQINIIAFGKEDLIKLNDEQKNKLCIMV